MFAIDVVHHRACIATLQRRAVPEWDFRGNLMQSSERDLRGQLTENSVAEVAPSRRLTIGSTPCRAQLLRSVTATSRTSVPCGASVTVNELPVMAKITSASNAPSSTWATTRSFPMAGEDARVTSFRRTNLEMSTRRFGSNRSYTMPDKIFSTLWRCLSASTSVIASTASATL